MTEERTLIGSTTGGFRIDGSGTASIRVGEDIGARTVEAPDSLAGSLLRRTENGFALESASGAETACLTRDAGCEPGAGPAWILRGDGRLFRVRPVVVGGGRFELTGWEVPGAYFTARPRTGGWTIVAEAAGGELCGVEELMVLFGAEILAAADADDASPTEDGES